MTGTGRYVDDVGAPGCLHLAFVRSPLAHAEIRAVDVAPAETLPGVVAVFTAENLELPARVGFEMVPAVFARPRLATGRVRFVGEPIAAVVAESRAAAADASHSVSVDLVPLTPVVDASAALRQPEPAVFEQHGSNVAGHFTAGTDEDPLVGAEVIARGRFINQRLAPVPMEPEAVLAVPEGGRLTLWATSQQPFALRAEVASSLGLEESDVRVIVPDMGGGFGAKAGARPEVVAVAAIAHRLGRPVRWTETRSENLVSMTHGRGQVQEVELGATRDGRLVGLRARITADVGAYPGIAVLLPFLTGQMSSGVYDIPRINYEARCAVTTTTPLGAYRGAGRPEAAAMVERAMDLLAAEIGMDPVELRRINLIPADRFPHVTAGGATYDSGDYARALDALLEVARYEDLRAEQRRRRESRERVQMGIGVSVYVEVTAAGIGPEWGAVAVEPGGAIKVRCGTTSFGQGHETALAQIAAEELGVPFESVTVVHSDTDLVERGLGSVGSRSMQHGGSAVHEAARGVREKARELAAHLLEANSEDIVFAAGMVGVAGVPDRALSWADLAAAAVDAGRLPEGMAPGLAEEADFAGEGSYPFGAHLAVAEVDVETGDARVTRFFAVDDCGRVINPLLAEGQVHGGIGQGTGQALYEEVLFDSSGNPLTASLLDYSIPSIGEIPQIVTESTVTPSPHNPLGAKGIGESGTIGSTPAIQNAVIDAVAHLGVRHIDMPLTPERVYDAITAAARPTGAAPPDPARGV